jgi:hypothetical protein
VGVVASGRVGTFEDIGRRSRKRYTTLLDATEMAREIDPVSDPEMPFDRPFRAPSVQQ